MNFVQLGTCDMFGRYLFDVLRGHKAAPDSLASAVEHFQVFFFQGKLHSIVNVNGSWMTRLLVAAVVV